MIQQVLSSDLFFVCLAEILAKASPEEIEESKSHGSRKTAAKAKSQKPPVEDRADPTSRQGKTRRPQPSEVDTAETPVKSPPKKKGKGKGKDTKGKGKGKDDEESDTPLAPRRLSFKKQDPKPERQISSLQKDRAPCFFIFNWYSIHSNKSSPLMSDVLCFTSLLSRTMKLYVPRWPRWKKLWLL